MTPQKPSTKTPSSSYFLIRFVSNRSLCFSNLKRQTANQFELLNAQSLIWFFNDLDSRVGRSEALFLLLSPNLIFYFLWVHCAVSLWWQTWVSLKASQWICIIVEILELGRSEAWIFSQFCPLYFHDFVWKLKIGLWTLQVSCMMRNIKKLQLSLADASVLIIVDSDTNCRVIFKPLYI